jgi:hypothetical protein
MPREIDGQSPLTFFSPGRAGEKLLEGSKKEPSLVVLITSEEEPGVLVTLAEEMEVPGALEELDWGVWVDDLEVDDIEAADKAEEEEEDDEIEEEDDEEEVVLGGSLVLVDETEVVDAGAEVEELEVGLEDGQSPVKEGTVLGPFPIVTKLDPQSSLLVIWMLWLSQL